MKGKRGWLITALCAIALIVVVLFIWPGIVRTEMAERKKEENPYREPERDRYVYPITIESPDWFSYSVPEKQEMLKIDAQSLRKMSDSMLVEAIADYPYLVDVLLSGTLEEGLADLADHCSAYAELITRENYQAVFTQNAGKLIEYYADNPRSDGQTEAVTGLLQEMIRYYQTKA